MKIGYLIGRYPTINHGYLLEEIRVLRSSGIEEAWSYEQVLAIT